MSEDTAVVGAPASDPTKPLTLQQAVAAQLAKLESAKAPTPAPAEETTNQDEVVQESAEGVEQEAEQATDETAATAGQEYEITDDSEILLPNGEKWSGKDLLEGLMKKADYTRKTQALQHERQTLERYTSELRSKVSQIEHDLVARHQQAEDSLKEAATRRDQYSEQLKRITEAQREHVGQWDRVDWDRVRRETPERIPELLLQRDTARDTLAKAEAEQRQLESESKAETERRQQEARESYARAWVGQKQALMDHVRQTHPVFTDPAKGNAEWGRIASTLAAVGMPEEVVQAAFGARHDPNVPLVSPPVFELIRKAALYDAAVAQHTKAKPQAEADLGKIRVVKAEAPRFRPPPADKAALGRARAQFNKTFSLKDAKAVELAKMLSRRT